MEEMQRGDDDDDQATQRRRRSEARAARARGAAGRSARRRTLDGGLDDDDDEIEAKETPIGIRAKLTEVQETPDVRPQHARRRGAWREKQSRAASASSASSTSSRDVSKQGKSPLKDSLGLDSVGAFWSTDRKSKGGSRRRFKLMLGDANADDDDEDEEINDDKEESNEEDDHDFSFAGQMESDRSDEEEEQKGEREGIAQNLNLKIEASPSPQMMRQSRGTLGNISRSDLINSEDKPKGSNKGSTIRLLTVSPKQSTANSSSLDERDDQTNSSVSGEEGPQESESLIQVKEELARANQDSDNTDDEDTLDIRQLITTARMSPPPRPRHRLPIVKQETPRLPPSALKRSPRSRKAPQSVKSVRFSVQKTKSPEELPSLPMDNEEVVEHKTRSARISRTQRSSNLSISSKSSREPVSNKSQGSTRSRISRALRPEDQEDILVASNERNLESEDSDHASLGQNDDIASLHLLDGNGGEESDDGYLGDARSEVESATARVNDQESQSGIEDSSELAQTPARRSERSRLFSRSSTKSTPDSLAVSSSGESPRTDRTERSDRSRSSRSTIIKETPQTRATSSTSRSRDRGSSSSSTSAGTHSTRSGALATPVSFSFRDAVTPGKSRRLESDEDDDEEASDRDDRNSTEDYVYRTAEKQPRRLVEPMFDPSKEPSTPGMRRSRRKRWRVLEHWRGERLIQQRKRDARLGIYIDEVVGAEKPNLFLTPAPPKRKKQKRSPSEELTANKRAKRDKVKSKLQFDDVNDAPSASLLDLPPDVVLNSSKEALQHFDPDRNTTVESILVRGAEDIELEDMPPDLNTDFHASDGKTVAAASARAGAAFEDDRFISGICVLPPLCSKPMESALGFTQIFIVAEAQPGSVVVQVDENRYRLSAGDHFWVPRHTSYGLRNYSENTTARINFILLKPHPEAEAA